MKYIMNIHHIYFQNTLNKQYKQIVMRQRFKTSRLCSSDNYEISRKIHKQDVINSHNNNKSIIATMVAKRTDKIPYVRIFGELMKISPEEANMLNTTVTVFWL